ncbi:Cytotoxic translational repressor of toxin-antitoxin stability system [Candidatus Nanobsidianus stetteri]|uniref:Cytotoxic translational repressor of toxin-antitoxin stability system n=1 Tax=Nanobsidianus stetteri TaxID=1294122 RepID=R1G3W5_NANST|nr:Cytotoxic translational repressor of toxin-antitoxin stability system [Candidatus Nanobsidianus stetteri]
MSILFYKAYRIFILDDNNLLDYERVKNNIKFWEKWIKDLKKELNNQHKIVLDRLESLKELRGKIERLRGEIKIGNLLIPLFSDRVNIDIRIIFSIFNNTNIIIVWGIDHHEKAYGKIIKHAEGFIKKHQKLILELLGIKTIYR